MSKELYCIVTLDSKLHIHYIGYAGQTKQEVTEDMSDSIRLLRNKRILSKRSIKSRFPGVWEDYPESA